MKTVCGEKAWRDNITGTQMIVNCIDGSVGSSQRQLVIDDTMVLNIEDCVDYALDVVVDL